MVKRSPAFPLHAMAINSLLISEKKLNFLGCFAEQCSLSTKNSELPNNLSFLTENRLSNVLISYDTMMKILNNLNSINFHDHDMKMLIL